MRYAISTAVVTACKKSEVKKGKYFVTAKTATGEAKAVGTRNYKIGETIQVKFMGSSPRTGGLMFEIVKGETK